MHDHLVELQEVVRAVLAPHVPSDSEARPFDSTGWDELEQLGFTSLTIPERLGGSGGDLRDAAVVVREAATFAGPIAEIAFLVGPLLTAAGISLPTGPVTAASSIDLRVSSGSDRSPRLSGSLVRVPWLRSSPFVMMVFDHPGQAHVALVKTDDPGFVLAQASNIAGEPRDNAVLNDVAVAAFKELPASNWLRRFELLGAAARATQMAGAAHGVLDLTLRHVRERTQFGRPLVKFQAVQHQFSQLAANVVTVDMAADSAVLALLRNDSATELTLAAGKGEASSLARQIAAGGHQAHGAMGFTMEHRLGAFTKRLWSWREEFGNERHWHECVAGLVVNGHGDVWAVLTNTPQ